MEGCLSVEWRVHASTFLPNKHSPRRWTATLVKQLWLIAFDMWKNRNHELHKNDLSNKIHELANIDLRIRSLLQCTNVHLLLYQRKLFHITAEELFGQTPKFRREWLKKAEIIEKSYLKRLADPANHKRERLVTQRWLQTIPHPTRVIPYNIHTQTIQPNKQQNTLETWFRSS